MATSNKSKQIRKRLDDSDDEEVVDGEVKVLKAVPVKSKTGKKKKAISTSAVLSFEDAEEDDEDTPFQVKKTKQSKNIKRRMMQAPGILESQHEVAPAPPAAVSEYSAESLKSLREKQNFSIPVAAVDTDSTSKFDGIELSGDAAESFEDLTVAEDDIAIGASIQQQQRQLLHLAHESAPSATSKHSGKPGFSALQPLDEIVPPKSSNGVPLPDYLPLEPSKRSEVTRNPESLQDDDNSAEEDLSWEEELARRGGIKTSASNSTNGESINSNGERGPSARGSYNASTSLQNAPSAPSRDKFTSSSAPSLSSITSSLRRNIATLTESCNRADRQLRHSETSITASTEEESELIVKVKERKTQLTFLTDFRLYLSDLVGMLRAKQPLIDELRAAVLTHLTLLRSREIALEVYDQERALDLLRKEEEVISLGGYEVHGGGNIPSEEWRSGHDISSELSKFHTAASVIFADCRPELCDVASVINNLRTFRSLQYEKYCAGYVSMSLPQLLDLFVGVDIWVHPLIDKAPLDLCSRPWFAPIFDYSTDTPATTASMPSSSEQNDLDSDQSLLPRVIIRTVIPWAASYISTYINPLDTAHVQSCRTLLEDLLDYDPTPSQMQPVLTACANILHQALGRICLPVLKMTTSSSVDFAYSKVVALGQLMENSTLLSSVVTPQVLCQFAWNSLAKAQESLVRALKCTEVRILNAVTRYCRALLKLIPGRDTVKAILQAQNQSSTETDIEDFFRKIEVPISAHNVLKSLVLNEVKQVATDAEKASFEYYRVALQKFLRQVPMMKS